MKSPQDTSDRTAEHGHGAEGFPALNPRIAISMVYELSTIVPEPSWCILAFFVVFLGFTSPYRQ
jgi:hypothetical protein